MEVIPHEWEDLQAPSLALLGATNKWTTAWVVTWKLSGLFSNSPCLSYVQTLEAFALDVEVVDTVGTKWTAAKGVAIGLVVHMVLLLLRQL